MNKVTLSIATGLVALIMSMNVQAGGHSYMQIDKIRGESQRMDAPPQPGMPGNLKTKGAGPQAVGLLLPAVQSAREAARSGSKKR